MGHPEFHPPWVGEAGGRLSSEESVPAGGSDDI